MIYLSGCVGPDVDPYRGHPRLGLLTGPGSYGAETVESWSPWAADNGCYSLAGRPFDEDRWLRWLDRCTMRSREVHHVLQRSLGGADDDSNLLALCPSHHAWAHGEIDLATRVGLLVPSWEARR